MNLVVITSCLNPIKKNLSVDVCGRDLRNYLIIGKFIIELLVKLLSFM